jgi:2'-hydroxyisoflavone reductase
MALKMPTRRDFMKRAAGGLLGAYTLDLGRLAHAAPGGVSPQTTALRILILGGTGFLGPHQVHSALARGHRVSVFNRGLTTADLPGAVEYLQGDRTGDLEALRGREWDVVIDNSASLPRWVRDSASLLSGSVGQYIFISTISVYAEHGTAHADETAALAPYRGADPMAEREVTNYTYGPLKALAEAEAERWFPGRAAVIRPGLIVGPGDTTDRFTYWPVRLARGGEILAPGSPADPVQNIDARDLAAWTIRVAEGKVTGTFNAVGPAGLLEVGEMLRDVGRSVGGEPRLTWVESGFLEAEGVQPWLELPAWVPASGETAGFMRRSNRRAVEAGLTFRSIEETARDTFRWFASLPAERQARLRAGLSPEKEAAVLRKWRDRPR